MWFINVIKKIIIKTSLKVWDFLCLDLKCDFLKYYFNISSKHFILNDF